MKPWLAVTLLLGPLPAAAQATVFDTAVNAAAQNIRMCIAEPDPEGHKCLSSGLGSNYHFYHLTQAKEWCGLKIPATVDDGFIRYNLARNKEPDAGLPDVYGAMSSFCVAGTVRAPEHIDRLRKVKHVHFSRDEQAKASKEQDATCPWIHFDDETKTLEVVSRPGGDANYTKCTAAFLDKHL